MSGWGGVLAAAFCAHAAATPSLMAEDHDCCRQKSDGQTEHCESASPADASHETMAMSETESAPPVTEEAEDSRETALNQAEKICLHCMSRSGPPQTFIVTRETEQQKRGASVTGPQVLKTASPFVVFFAPAPTARQNAPPGASARRHLLFNVFIV